MKKESFDLLLKEYDNLFQDWTRIRKEGSKRMKLLLNMTVFVLSGLGLLFQLGSKDFQVILLFCAAGFGLLLIVAFHALQFMINRNISSDHYLRAMSRIRKCFTEHDNELAKYLTWKGNDTPTSFLDFANLGLINQTLIFLSVFASGFLCSLSRFFFHQDLIKLLIAFFTMLPVIYLGLYFLIRVRLKRAREKATNEIKFDFIHKDV